MTKQESEKPGLKRLHYKFVLVAVAGSIIIYLVLTYGNEIGSLFTNRHRPTNIEVSAERKWAERLEVPGVPNLHKVSQELYRGGQPTEKGMKELKKLGIRTVVNLRSFHSDRDEIADAGLAYEHIYMKTWSTISSNRILRT